MPTAPIPMFRPRKVSRPTPNPANEMQRRVLARFPRARELPASVWFTGSNIWTAALGEPAPAGADWDVIVDGEPGDGLGCFRDAVIRETLGIDGNAPSKPTAAKAPRADRPKSYDSPDFDACGGVCYTTDRGEVDMWRAPHGVTAQLRKYPSASHAHCRVAFSLDHGVIMLPNELAPQRATPAAAPSSIGWRAVAGAVLVGVLIGLLLLASGCCNATPAPLAPAAPVGRTVEQQAADAVLITRECEVAEGIYFGRGSGVVVAPGTVLTAMHVVTCATGDASFGVLRRDGTSAAASVVWRDPEHDLALLAAPGILPAGPLVVVYSALGQTVCAEVAFPARARMCGAITGRTAVVATNGVLDIRTTINTVPGNSGAGLYDERGALVGVVTNRTACGVDKPGEWCGNLSVTAKGRLPW